MKNKHFVAATFAAISTIALSTLAYAEPPAAAGSIVGRLRAMRQKALAEKEPVTQDTAALSVSPATPDRAPYKWVWRCRSDGYYVLDIAPDGTYKADVDTSLKNVSYTITLEDKPCPLHTTVKATLSDYTVNVESNNPYGDNPDWHVSDDHGFCFQKTFVTLGTTIKQIDSFKSVSFDRDSWLILKSDDDNTWLFEIFETHLMTKKAVREIGIRFPGKFSSLKAGASASIISGPCLLEQHPL